MENYRRVTEEDLLVTEALIARSYGKLKQSVVQAPSRVLNAAGKTAGEHPYATAATAIVAGAGLYGIFRMMTANCADHTKTGRQEAAMQSIVKRENLMYEMLMMIVPMLIPLIPRFLPMSIGGILFKKRTRT